ncbi:MAG TPA: hypothetical protein VFB34_02105 [Chloroflexota bacterium]|nr:hypothetical protein [Chloroflexota bacterium]
MPAAERGRDPLTRRCHPASRTRLVTRHWSRLLLALLITVTIGGWAPSLRDPSSGYQLLDSQMSAVGSDRVPQTIGPVVDVVDGATGRPLVAERAYEKHAIGSLTKLMTVELAVRHLPLDRIITINQQAASEPGSTMWLEAGDRVSVRSLLYGALIPSGNDAAEALALAVAGTERRFALMMNREAKAFGLQCSHYVTPHGLDAPNEYSCAEDVAHMTRIVLRTPLLSRIVATKHIVVPSAQKGLDFNLVNTNLLLGNYPGIIGVKTGTTDATGAAVSAAARRNGHVVIAVVLGSTDFGRFSDAASLLTFAFDDYTWPSNEDTMWSTESLMRHRRDATAPIPQWELPWITVNRGGYVDAPYDPR